MKAAATTTTIAINGGLNWSGSLGGGDIDWLRKAVAVVAVEGAGDGAHG